MLILRYNSYFRLNYDHLLGKQCAVLSYGSQPSKTSCILFGDVFYLFLFFTVNDEGENYKFYAV